MEEQRRQNTSSSNEQPNLFGIPIGKEVSMDALIHDFWDPTSEEILQPKRFLGLGWGINFFAIAKKAGIL